MREIDSENVAGILAELGWISPEEPLRVCLLTGGVSNMVMHVHRESPGGGSISRKEFVLKQARHQLAVEEPWFCSVERLEREVLVLKACQRLLQTEQTLPLAVGVPGLLADDAGEHLYAMESAGVGHRTWKEDLLAGRPDSRGAVASGWLLGHLHGASWGDSHLARVIGDQQFFEDLRLDPYYRQVARGAPELSSELDELVENARQPICLVHGDMSPKNLLVNDSQLMLIDFEVGHFGDPAFDLGFFQTHLLLKTLRAGQQASDYWELITCFQESYWQQLEITGQGMPVDDLKERSLRHLGGCLLARVDGKSPVDYLDERFQEVVRRIGRGLLCRQIDSWDTVRQQVLSEASAR
ncbi:MAG: phosphotransferase [Pirellulaceae bacterium]